MVAKKPTENNHKFSCEICDFKCCKKRDYDRHLDTRKHKLGVKCTHPPDSVTEKAPKAPKATFSCEDCSKTYLSRKGLWSHKKKCCKKNENKIEQTEIICKLIQQNMELISQNKEFKDLIVEQTKAIADLASKNNTNIVNNNCNNTNNNKFNMNIFLNEKCKDALNIMDFVTSLPLNLVDLEETGKQGYVKGLSRILINGLKDIDISKRPIHCSDLKRETIYVKDNNVWEKEDTEKKRIKNAIKYISLKNAKQITKWTKENEGYRDSNNKKSDVYLKLVYEANGGDEDELNKIIKNISANVIIDKTEN